MALLLVLVLGALLIADRRIDQMYKNAETMYNHPLRVRSAVGIAHITLVSIHSNMLEAVYVKDKNNLMQLIEKINQNKSLLDDQIQTFQDYFLGPKKDIANLRTEVLNYYSFNNEIIRMLESGNFNLSEYEKKYYLLSKKYLQATEKKLAKIDAFARGKSAKLIKNSELLNKQLDYQYLILAFSMFFLVIGAYVLLLRHIRTPLDLLMNSATRFRDGDYSVRSSFVSKNEFGRLSETFNLLAATIENRIVLLSKRKRLFDVKVSENDLNVFFKDTITTLLEVTESEIAALFLVSHDGKQLTHLHSVGLTSQAINDLQFKSPEGEFAKAISTGHIEFITNIPEDTKLVFMTVSGAYLPREIVTIPIFSMGECIAVISLASIRPYNKLIKDFLNEVHDTLSTRISMILAFRRLQEVMGLLEAQNKELEFQKTELAQQADELHQQNKELEMQKMQLAEASRLKTTFLSNMSHELRTPLNSVIALAGVLHRKLAGRLPDEEHGYLEVIERNGKHLLALINDILDLSRIESGRVEMEISKFRITVPVKEAVQLILPQAEAKGVEIVIEDNNIDIEVESDLAKLRHILLNLIGNAVKFTERGTVQITIKHSGAIVSIAVIDSGIGIEPKHIQYIFDEFRQADTSTSRKFGGTGLGLAIAKKYSEMLGAKISVESTPGIGSTFTLTLPVVYSEVSKLPQSSIEPYCKTPKEEFLQYSEIKNVGKRILLVEDSEPAIIQIEDVLKYAGFDVTVARNGNDAIKMITEKPPDAMILDLMMPEIDGFEVLKKVRAQKISEKLPVLILTAKHITKEEMSFLKGNNISQLLQKGDINRVELLQSVMNMLLKEENSADNRLEKSFENRRKTHGEQVKILVVEDNHDNMLTVKALLQDDYIVVEAENGALAIEVARRESPDLILMDIALPVMDGIQAFLNMKKIPHLQKTPVIALTASAMVQDRETILAHGFNAFIAKPIDRQEFFSVIEGVLYGT